MSTSVHVLTSAAVVPHLPQTSSLGLLYLGLSLPWQEQASSLLPCSTAAPQAGEMNLKILLE